MTDKITLKRIELLHPKVRGEVKEKVLYLWRRDIPIRITDGLRTIDEQNELYKQGRDKDKPGKIVTKVRGGDSYHNWGLAFDFCLLLKNKQVTWDRKVDLNKDQYSDWAQIVDLFKSYENEWEWGGDFIGFFDGPHLQRTFGKTINELKYLKEQGQVDENGYVII